MADLPSIDNKTPKKKNPPKTQQRLPESVPASEGYIPRTVDVKMNRHQARILRDKLRELQDSGAKTADGRYVTNRSQAVRWILENQVK